uniref:Uncharacterized protein n=1 Tax=Rhizophagus irregularis (strain DAOM 181602 / DAOM 197198 / MUCL 43194) TaxID=747089 RepID=U9TJA3_RHIID
MMRSQTFDYFIIPTSHIHQISGIDQITWRHMYVAKFSRRVGIQDHILHEEIKNLLFNTYSSNEFSRNECLKSVLQPEN